MRLPAIITNYILPLSLTLGIAAALSFYELYTPFPLPKNGGAEIRETTQGKASSGASSGARQSETKSHATEAINPTTVKKTATTTQPVRVRADKSTDSKILLQLEAGKAVEVTTDSDASWQGVIVGGQKGYIYKEYLVYDK